MANFAKCVVESEYLQCLHSHRALSNTVTDILAVVAFCETADNVPAACKKHEKCSAVASEMSAVGQGEGFVRSQM